MISIASAFSVVSSGSSVSKLHLDPRLAGGPDEGGGDLRGGNGSPVRPGTTTTRFPLTRNVASRGSRSCSRNARLSGRSSRAGSSETLDRPSPVAHRQGLPHERRWRLPAGAAEEDRGRVGEQGLDRRLDRRRLVGRHARRGLGQLELDRRLPAGRPAPPRRPRCRASTPGWAGVTSTASPASVTFAETASSLHLCRDAREHPGDLLRLRRVGERDLDRVGEPQPGLEAADAAAALLRHAEGLVDRCPQAELLAGGLQAAALVGELDRPGGELGDLPLEQAPGLVGGEAADVDSADHDAGRQMPALRAREPGSAPCQACERQHDHERGDPPDAPPLPPRRAVDRVALSRHVSG